MAVPSQLLAWARYGKVTHGVELLSLQAKWLPGYRTPALQVLCYPHADHRSVGESLKRERIVVLLAILLWLLWIWVYNFLLGGTELWKCLVATALLPVLAMAAILAIGVRQRWRPR